VTPSEPAAELTASSTLDAAQAQAVLALAEAATAVDGVSPLDDQVRLDLAHSGSALGGKVTHVVARRGTVLAGYAHARATEAGPLSAHLVVAPEQRRHGIGTALVSRLVELSGGSGLRVWAHGDDAAAGLLSEQLGFTRVRDLWQMRRRLDLPIAPPAYPPDVHVRTFEVGQDEAAWVRVNAEAFADHPEQGAITEDDLRQRIAEPWFDPLGFFLAVRGTDVLGFHWTKVHPATPTQPDPLGEVYAVGVSPAAQGLGLGKALTTTGLLHLRAIGLREVLLYVDGDNAAAIAVYEKLDFTRHTLDVMYEHA
jgi:mycothiol synthase